ncbi:hypothetical protein Tco_1211102 [Tanacetum coccineum]
MARNPRSDENWVTNMYQKIEAACQDIDDFVYKEPVLFVGNQVQTVCRSVKKFYSDVMQDLILSPKCIDLAEASTSSVAAVKETTVRRNISKPKEAPVVPEMRHQPSISALRKLKRISSEDSVPHRDDNLLSKAADQAIQVPLNSSTSNQETVVMEQSACKDEKCDDDHELFLSEDLENNERSSELVDTESSQSDKSYLDALLNTSTSSQEEFTVEQSSCKDEKCDDGHEKFFRELYENHKSSLELLSYETLESDDSVSEDGDCGMKEKKFDIRSDAKFLRELLEKKELCNVSSQSNDSELENEGSGIEDKKIEVLFREKLEKYTILSKQLSNASSQSDDLVSEDGYWGMEEKEFGIKSDAKFLRELLEKKTFCNVSSQSDDSRLVNGGSGIEGKKIEVLFHEKLENDATSSKLLNNESSQSKDSVSEDGDWGIEDISDLNVGTDEQIEVESSENKSFEMESSITFNENKEDSSSSYFKSVAAEPDTINCNPAEGQISIPSRGLSSCEPVTVLGCDSSNDPTRLASSSYAVSDDTIKTDEPVSITGLGTSEYSHNWNVAEFEASCWSEIGGAEKSTVDSEELIMENIDLSENKQLAESCVIVDGKLLNFPHKSKGSRSYKKIIQDAFISKRRLTKEYEQLSILYGDIDNEFNPPIGNGIAPKLTEYLPDSEWEIL